MFFRRIKNMLIISVVFMLSWQLFSQERKIELAVVRPGDIKKGIVKEKVLLGVAKECGIIPARQPKSLFTEKMVELKQYKRIWVTGGSNKFSIEEYEGMKRFVEDGGLLITENALNIVDNDKDQLKNNYGPINNGVNHIVGLAASRTNHFKRFKILIACPLSEGFPVNQWLTLEISGKCVKTAGNAAVVALAEGSFCDKGGIVAQPLLTFKRSGKGACIFLVCRTSDNEQVKSFIKNIMSTKTLNWLCDQKH